jgi:predicted nucleic acid-binding protein
MGLTVLDAGVLIGFLDTNDAHHAAASTALRDAYDRGDHLALPASAFTEMLVGPHRKGPEAVETATGLIERLPVRVVPLEVEIAVAAAALRARHRSLKLPDALVVATASHLDADHLITTDGRWPSSEDLGLGAELVVL